MSLNEGQSKAIYAITQWLHEETFDPFFVLKGGAGTGKTFCIQELQPFIDGEIIYTAPTNKATKVLRETITKPGYRPICLTIYKLLGLRLEDDSEIKELKRPEHPAALSIYKLVVVDEGSMIPAKLFQYIRENAELHKVRFLFMGDRAQLPPVGEKESPIWALTRGAELTKVMRHDNAILEVATRIREQVDEPYPKLTLESNNDGIEGVWKCNRDEFMAAIREHAASGQLAAPYVSKIIAWRNTQVDAFNKIVRDIIFDKPKDPWVVGDRVIFTSHAKGPFGPLATTDDEGTVTAVEVKELDIFKCWAVKILLDDERVVVAEVLHEDSRKDFHMELDRLASDARSKIGKWSVFWAVKEMFHQIKHAYAITAHRSQGSTYETALVCHQDILRNPNVNEAYRCLYVAASRPKKKLILS